MSEASIKPPRPGPSSNRASSLRYSRYSSSGRGRPTTAWDIKAPIGNDALPGRNSRNSVKFARPTRVPKELLASRHHDAIAGQCKTVAAARRTVLKTVNIIEDAWLSQFSVDCRRDGV